MVSWLKLQLESDSMGKVVVVVPTVTCMSVWFLYLLYLLLNNATFIKEYLFLFFICSFHCFSWLTFKSVRATFHSYVVQ